MATLSRDTSEQAEAVQIRLLRAMPIWRRAELWNDAIHTGHELALAGLRRRFPRAGPDELRRRLATLLLGPDLASKVYGPEPHPPGSA